MWLLVLESWHVGLACGLVAFVLVNIAGIWSTLVNYGRRIRLVEQENGVTTVATMQRMPRRIRFRLWREAKVKSLVAWLRAKRDELVEWMGRF